MYSLQLFLDFMKEYYWTITFYFLCTFLSYPVESVFLPQLYSSFFANIQKKPTQEVFLYYFGLIFLLIVIVNISNIITNIIESELLPEWKGYFMDWIFQKLLKMYENKMTDIELGKLIVDLVFLPRLSRELVQEFVTWGLPRILSVLFIQIYLFLVDWRMGIMTTGIFIVYLYISYNMFATCAPLATEEHLHFEKKMQNTQDRMSNTFSIYSVGNVSKEIEQYQTETAKYVKQDKAKMECMWKSNMYTSFFIVLTMMSMNGFSSYLFLHKKINFTTLMSLFMIVLYYIPSMTSINSEIPSILVKWSILESKDDFISALYKVDSSKSKDYSSLKQKVDLQSGGIDIRNLSFSYTPESPKLLDHFSIHIADQSKTAILGPSGSGKSSLIKVIMGYYPVPNGTVFIDGHDINQLDLNYLRKQVSFVNQNTKLFQMSLLENICYGNEDSGKCTSEHIHYLMRKLGIQEVFRNVDLKDDVGIEGNKLSGGQRQIVHLLRCILRKNHIVILDEPTSALDSELKAAVIRTIQWLSKQSTLIIITHDESLLFLVDRVIRMG